MAVEVRVPTLGESVTEATVATWFKKVGDAVAVDEMLCELETDKVTVEVPSPVAGALVEIVAPEGTTVGVAALLAQVGEAAAKPQSPVETTKAAVARPGAGEGKMIDVMVPALGESVSEATVSTWFKKPGDAVAQDEMLCELETDKVSVEVPSPAAGVAGRNPRRPKAPPSRPTRKLGHDHRRRRRRRPRPKRRRRRRRRARRRPASAAARAREGRRRRPRRQEGDGRSRASPAMPSPAPAATAAS